MTRRPTGRTLSVLTGLCGALVLGLLASRAPAGENAGGARPNILLVIADDWSYGHASIYGRKWINTPAFDRVAREGALFNNSFTSNPKCSPCRASLLTGRSTWQTEEASCHFGVFPAKWAVYPDLLEQAGYHVGYTGKGWGPGDWKSGGFKRNPAGPDYNGHRAPPPHRGISNIDYARNFARFLEARKPGQPFCFWLGSQEPHRVYEDGVGVRAGKKTADVDLPAYYPDSDLIRSDFLDYAVEVEWFDTHLGRAIQHLEKAGELENTLILVTSDHGCPFPRVKGQIYEHGYHLPLAVRWGRVRPGRVIDDFINVRDFAPTFLELAGVKVPATMTGRSFADALRSEKSGWLDVTRSRMLIGKERHDLGRPDDGGYPVRALRTPEYLYVRNYTPDRWPVCNPETGYGNCDDGPTKTLLTSQFNAYYRLCFGKRPAEELYRVTDDPDCVKNLAGDAALRTVRETLREEMEALLRKDGDPRILGRGSVFDTYKYTGPRGHSYEAWLKFQK
jgi:N-sulfoglucosamine sulfohydrolase